MPEVGLTDLPEDLIDEIAIQCDHRACYQLALASRSFHRFLQKFLLIQTLVRPVTLYEPRITTFLNAIRQLVSNSHSNRRIVKWLRQLMTYDDAIVLIDIFAPTRFYRNAMENLIVNLKLNIFAEIAPGILLGLYRPDRFDAQLIRSNLECSVRSPIASKPLPTEFDLFDNIQTVQGGIDTIRRLFDDEFESISELLSEFPSYLSLPRHYLPSTMLMELSYNHPDLLTDRSLLLSLLRLGIRFEFCTFMAYINTRPQIEQLKAVVPLLNDDKISANIAGILVDLLYQSRFALVLALLEIGEVQAAIRHQHRNLGALFFASITMEYFNIFRLLCQYGKLRAVSSWKQGSDKRTFLHAAVLHFAPLDVIDEILFASKSLRHLDVFGKTALDYAEPETPVYALIADRIAFLNGTKPAQTTRKRKRRR